MRLEDHLPDYQQSRFAEETSDVRGRAIKVIGISDGAVAMA
jgi:hypothetical protein